MALMADSDTKVGTRPLGKTPEHCCSLPKTQENAGKKANARKESNDTVARGPIEQTWDAYLRISALERRVEGGPRFP